MLPEQQQRIMGYFIEEAKDHLNTIEQGLLNLQGTLQDQEMVNEVFRAAHSVKGGAAMLGIGSIQKTAHRLEDYFKVLKEEERPIQVDQKLESLFLQVFDALHELLEQLQGPFGLTEDVANGIMSGVEPVFEELHNHLEYLVHQGAGTAPQPAVTPPTPQAVPVVTVNPVLVVFQGDVSARLRDLLQAFKQAESAQSRQELQELCAELKRLGESFNLSPWCELLDIARQAIACPDNSYRVLAPIVIKEIKQAQDLVLGQRVGEVLCSDRLRELLPVATPVVETTGEADLADLFGITADTSDNVAVDDLFGSGADGLSAIPEVVVDVQPPVVAAVTPTLSDYGFGDDLADGLDFEQPGPEVGMAELNSLADLFEGEVLDLGATWQEEEIINGASDGGALDLGGSGDLDDFAGADDFSDLLSDFEDEDSAPVAATGVPQDDLESLFGDDSLLADADTGSGVSPTASNGAGASVTDEIDELFGDDFLTLEESGEISRTEVAASPLDNLGELFAGLDESQIAVPDLFPDRGMGAGLEDSRLDQEEEPAGTVEAELAFDESLFDTPAESSEAVPPEPLFEDSLSPEALTSSGDLDLDLFGDDQTEESSTDPMLGGLTDSGDLDLDLFGDDQAEDSSADAMLGDLTSSGDLDLDLFGDDQAEEIAAVAADEALGDLDDFLGDAEESAMTEDPLSEFFGDEGEPPAEVSAAAASSAVQSPWDEEFQLSFEGGTESAVDDALATSNMGNGGADLVDDLDLFGLGAESEELDASLVSNSEVLDDNSALDFDLASLSDEPSASLPSEEPGLEGDNGFLPDFNFEVESALGATEMLTDSSEGLDFLLDAADLEEIQASESSEGTTDAEPAAADSLDDLWSEEVSLEAPMAATSATNTDASSAGDEIPSGDWLGTGEPEASETDIDFSGSLDSLFDEASEDFGSLDLDVAAAEPNLNGLDAIAAAPGFDGSAADDLFGLSEPEFSEGNVAPELNLEDMGDTPDLEVDLFGMDGAEDGLAELSEADRLETAATDTSFLSDMDLFASDDNGGDLATDPLDLLGLEAMDGEGGTDLDLAVASSEDVGTDLDDLLADSPTTEGLPESPVAETSAEDDFADLDALLNDAPSASPVASSNGTTAPSVAAEDDFADLEALLGDAPSVPVPTAMPATPVATVTPVAKPVAVDSEFDDLEKLLEDADKTMGGSPTVKSRGPAAQPRRAKNPNVIDQTMRVPVKQLDNLSNLVGELVVNRNSLEQDQERLRQFLDNLLYQVQQLSDVGQRMRDLYERSLLESSLLASRQSYQSSPNGGSSAQSHSTGASFDALEMDRFTGFHSLSQEMIELIVRVRESSSDIEFIIDETDQVTRNFRQVTTQLQEGLTRSRMVPFAQTADRLPRGVRDNAIKCGKQAELVVEGRETLIDKMILEQLYDPLNHLVNNAIAHGIETPDVRQAAGKPPVGRVTIRAFYQGNQTVISVSDDGAGIDPERIKAKAIQKKLITAADAKTMSRLDVYDILFAPGFSGADEVTDLAGRGVGMDVVRTRLNEIRGTINTDSTIGKGTTFTIRLPLTLSISKALCCISNRARIAFPMDGVEDMLDVPKERIQTNAEGQSCILWRDLLLPFQSLSDVLKYSRYLGRGSVYGGNQEDDIVSIVVLRSAGNFIALQVDQVLGEQEIVIKQLEGPVPKPIGVAGATVLGDGRIMPIADVLELIDLVQGRIPHNSSTKLWDQTADQIPVEPPVAKTEPTVLIVDDSITVRELLSMTFNKVGYRVEQARDGQEAWEKLRSGLPCDMVFCDIEMPRMDGLELLSRIQKDVTLNHLPIAMLTSRGADRHRQMAVQLGARGYFTKPYLEEALLDAAQRMLKGEILVTSGSAG